MVSSACIPDTTFDADLLRERMVIAERKTLRIDIDSLALCFEEVQRFRLTMKDVTAGIPATANIKGQHAQLD